VIPRTRSRGGIALVPPSAANSSATNALIRSTACGLSLGDSIFDQPAYGVDHLVAALLEILEPHSGGSIYNRGPRKNIALLSGFFMIVLPRALTDQPRIGLP